MRRRATTLVKALVSLGLLGYLIAHLDYVKLKGMLHAAVPLWMIVSTLILIARNWVGAWRCRLLLQAKGLEASISDCVVLYFTSQFFNIFLPTSLGGEVVRGYYLGKKTKHMTEAAATVVMERILGFVALIMLVMVLLPFFFVVIGNVKIFYLALGMSLVSLFFIVMLLSRRMGAGSALRGLGFIHQLLSRLKSLLYAVQSFKGRPQLVHAFILSLIFQLAGIYSTYLLAKGLGQTIPLFYFLLIMPMVQIISLFPFTLNGIGIREGAFVYLFVLMGVDAQVGLSVGLLFFVQLLVLSIIGGIIYVFRRDGLKVAVE